MKHDYLKALKEKLNEFQASKQDIDDILSDYEQLYDDAYDKYQDHDKVKEILGHPKDVAHELIDTLHIKKEKGIKTKIIAIMPFISVILFMELGFGYDLWHIGWLVFLLIPMTAILFSTRLKEGIIAISPFVSVIVYLILGFGFDAWHPGWLVFLSIPVISILLSAKTKDIPVSISVFVSVIVFVLVGTLYDIWNPTWLIFLSTPMIGVLYKENKFHVVIYELSFVLAIGIYLFVGYTYGLWQWGALGFILPVLVGLIFGDVLIGWVYPPKGLERTKFYIMALTILSALGAFLALGYLLDGWAYAWQVFLLIPVIAILINKPRQLTPIMPFVAVVLFFSLGYFFDLFHISWMAFLLIPMVAIMENA